MAVGAFLSIPCRMRRLGLSSRAKCVRPLRKRTALVHVVYQKELMVPHSSERVTETMRIITRIRHLVSKVMYHMDGGSVSSITIQKGRNVVH